MGGCSQICVLRNNNLARLSSSLPPRRCLLLAAVPSEVYQDCVARTNVRVASESQESFNDRISGRLLVAQVANPAFRDAEVASEVCVDRVCICDGAREFAVILVVVNADNYRKKRHCGIAKSSAQCVSSGEELARLTNSAIKSLCNALTECWSPIVYQANLDKENPSTYAIRSE